MVAKGELVGEKDELCVHLGELVLGMAELVLGVSGLAEKRLVVVLGLVKHPRSRT